VNHSNTPEFSSQMMEWDKRNNTRISGTLKLFLTPSKKHESDFVKFIFLYYSLKSYFFLVYAIFVGTAIKYAD